ncbi:hypothetical protein D1872_338120 [compost metagenome]
MQPVECYRGQPHAWDGYLIPRRVLEAFSHVPGYIHDREVQAYRRDGEEGSPEPEYGHPDPSGYSC